MTEQQQREPTPEERERQALAAADERTAALEASADYFQRRAVALNVEVRNRDAIIAELEAKLALAERGDQPDLPPPSEVEPGNWPMVDPEPEGAPA